MIAATHAAVAQQRANQAPAGNVSASPSEARWQAGVIALVARAKVSESCVVFGRANPHGVTRAVLAVDIHFERATRERCQPAENVIEKTFNFPSIARGTTQIELRFMFQGQPAGTEMITIARPGNT
ncbi:MAG: hypothetical protein WCH83_10495 [Alphaproteobacteria bacterium]